MILEKHHIDSFNEMMNPNNNKVFYSIRLKEFVRVVLLPCGFMADQPGKRHYTNHAGGNSEYGGVWGISCNVRDMINKLPSCMECQILLTNGVDSSECSNCLN